LPAAISLAAVLGACGGSSPESSKTATAHPSAAITPVGGTLATTGSKVPLAAPTPSTGPTPPTGVVTSAERTTGHNPTPGIQPATAPATPAGGATSVPLATASTAMRASETAATSPKRPKPGTAAWEPRSPQPSASLGAWQLLDAWAADNRTTALQDASPAAVAALFSYTYPEAGVQFRGCSSPPGQTASSCAYRDGNDLLSLTVSLFARGWAVTGAVLES
jgi:hypothetical protein